MIAPTALPGARTAAGTDASEGAVHREQAVVLPAERTEALQRLVQLHGLTLNTAVQGAWALLLSRYSGEGKVVVRAPRARRPTTRAKAGTLVGRLHNPPPVR